MDSAALQQAVSEQVKLTIGGLVVDLCVARAENAHLKAALAASQPKPDAPTAEAP